MSKVAGGACRCRWQRCEKEEGLFRRQIQGDKEVIVTSNININNEYITVLTIASTLSRQQQEECHTIINTTKGSIDEYITISRHTAQYYDNSSNDNVNNNGDALFELTLDIGKTAFKSMNYSRDHNKYPLEYYRTFSSRLSIESFAKWFTFIIKNNNNDNDNAMARLEDIFKTW